MRYIDTWLNGLGLDYIIPKLRDHGITTPKQLATLSLREIYEVGMCFHSTVSTLSTFIRQSAWKIQMIEKSYIFSSKDCKL
jgi:predicted aldo/keto reductase-like oxidoreductase